MSQHAPHPRSWLATALLLLLCVAPSTVSAQGMQDFLLVNETGVDVFRVYVSPHDVNDWEEDVMGEDVLLDGEAVEIGFHRSESSKWWDLRVEDEQGNSLTWESLDLLTIYSVTLFYDADSGRAWAETEAVPPSSVIQAQFAEMESSLAEEGFHRSGSLLSGALSDGASETVTVRLEGGRHYAIVGACDEDCDDLDLTLFSEMGAPWLEDVLDDDLPVLEVDTRQMSGSLELEVTMVSCGQEPCGWAVQLFLARRQLDQPLGREQ